MITLHWFWLLPLFILGMYTGRVIIERALKQERVDEVAKSRDLGRAEGLGEGFERGVEYSRASYEGRRAEALSELVSLSQLLVEASREFSR